MGKNQIRTAMHCIVAELNSCNHNDPLEYHTIRGCALHQSYALVRCIFYTSVLLCCGEIKVKCNEGDVVTLFQLNLLHELEAGVDDNR